MNQGQQASGQCGTQQNGSWNGSNWNWGVAIVVIIIIIIIIVIIWWAFGSQNCKSDRQDHDKTDRKYQSS